MNLTNANETVGTTYNYDAFGNILAGSSIGPHAPNSGHLR